LAIKGSADTAGFRSYRLEYGAGSQPQRWTAIERSAVPVTDGVLGTLDTNDLEPGVYSIRLVVQDEVRGLLIDTITVGVGPLATPTPGGDEEETPPVGSPTPTPLPYPVTR
jgi:hypothetical protein